MNSKESVFEYRVVKGKTGPTAHLIQEELNKGLTFNVTIQREQIVHLDCHEKDWTTVDHEGNQIIIQVDDSFFEGIPPITKVLTSLWSNLMDFGQLRLEGIQFSGSIHQKMLSRLNMSIVSDIFNGDGPYFGMQIKPYHLDITSRIALAQKFAEMGGTFLKEDETYFKERSQMILQSRRVQGAISEISDTCFYIPNITPWFGQNHIESSLSECGVKIGLVAYLIIGLHSVYNQQGSTDLNYWGHRVGYETMQQHISMKALGTLALYSGINFIHIGTPNFSSNDSIESVKAIWEVVDEFPTNPVPVFTKTSPEIVSRIVKHFGKRVILMACGSLRTQGRLDNAKIAHWMECV